MQVMGQSDNEAKEIYLRTLSLLSVETLKILAELSKKPNIEKKLKEKQALINLFI
jgi:hypothetical protein